MDGLHLHRKTTTAKTGNESFCFHGNEIGRKLLDFWEWSASDLLSNTARGILAEFIVATALEADITPAVRETWGEYDLEIWEWGRIRVEVKSAAYLQTWDQRKYSNIVFSIKKKGITTIKKDKNQFSRPSDVYVFCLLNHRDKKTVDPLKLEQWSFYVVSTKTIDANFGDRNSLSLKSLEKIASPIDYPQLKSTISGEAKK